MAEQTVRDKVRVIERAMLKGDVQPADARQYLSIATALLGSVGREVVEADLAYKSFLAGCRRNCKTAAQARIEAEDSPHFRRKLEAEAEQANCEQIAMSLKKILSSLEREMSLVR